MIRELTLVGGIAVQRVLIGKPFRLIDHRNPELVSAIEEKDDCVFEIFGEKGRLLGAITPSNYFVVDTDKVDKRDKELRKREEERRKKEEEKKKKGRK